MIGQSDIGLMHSVYFGGRSPLWTSSKPLHCWLSLPSMHGLLQKVANGLAITAMCAPET